MSQVQKFQFGLMDLRVVDLQGEPWFVASDVCRGLGYSVKADGTINVTQAVGALQADEVRRLPRTTFCQTKGGASVPVISESGLYKLVMRSDKPEAKAFQDWVTRVVLPAIRKDGAYIQGEEKVVTGEMSDDELLAKAFGILQKKTERLTLERDRAVAHAVLLEQEKAHLESYHQLVLPHATVGQAVGARKGLSVVDFARKLEGVNVNQVRNDLGAMQYLFRRSGTWAVYAKFRDTLFSEKAAPDGRTVIVALEKGQQLLVDLYHDGRLTMKAGCKPNRRLSLEACA
jgi:prophage antirepressor-like protein